MSVGVADTVTDRACVVLQDRPVVGLHRGLVDLLLAADRDGRAVRLPIFPGVYAGPQPPGRGWWVRRGEPGRLVQIAADRDTP